MFIFSLHVYCSTVCIAVLHTLVAGLLARSQYPEGPATGHLSTGFSCFPCVYNQILRWFPTLQVATACFSCSAPDLNLLDPDFNFMYMHNNQRATANLQLNILLLLLLLLLLSYHYRSQGRRKIGRSKKRWREQL